MDVRRFTREHADVLLAGAIAKLGLRDRVQAVVLAYETGLVQPS